MCAQTHAHKNELPPCNFGMKLWNEFSESPCWIPFQFKFSYCAALWKFFVAPSKLLNLVEDLVQTTLDPRQFKETLFQDSRLSVEVAILHLLCEVIRQTNVLCTYVLL